MLSTSAQAPHKFAKIVPRVSSLTSCTYKYSITSDPARTNTQKKKDAFAQHVRKHDGRLYTNQPGHNVDISRSRSRHGGPTSMPSSSHMPVLGSTRIPVWPASPKSPRRPRFCRLEACCRHASEPINAADKEWHLVGRVPEAARCTSSKLAPGRGQRRRNEKPARSSCSWMRTCATMMCDHDLPREWLVAMPPARYTPMPSPKRRSIAVLAPLWCRRSDQIYSVQVFSVCVRRL